MLRFLTSRVKYLTSGDYLDNRALFVSIQNRANNTDISNSYFDELIEYMWNNYTINPNRISGAGISRGGRVWMGTPGFLKTRYEFWINTTTGVLSTTDLGSGYTKSGLASIVNGTSDVTGTYVEVNYDGIGLVNVHGHNAGSASDGTLTNNNPTLATNFGRTAGLKEYPYLLNIYNNGHNATVWHNNCFNRQTAPFDYVDFLLRYSRNLEECATLFVEQAERKKLASETDIIEYREAFRKVSQLPTGATKTSLEGRLAILKPQIDAGKKRWIINHTINTIIQPNSGSTNWIFDHSAGQSVRGHTGRWLTDDNGIQSTNHNWRSITNSVFTKQGEIPSSRGRHNAGGLHENYHRAGMFIQASTITMGFSGLTGTSYSVRIYCNDGSALTTEGRLSVTIGGETKTMYTPNNSLIGYIQFDGKSTTDLSSYTCTRGGAKDVYLTATELIQAV